MAWIFTKKIIIKTQPQTTVHLLNTKVSERNTPTKVLLAMNDTTVFYKYNLFFIGRTSEELFTHIGYPDKFCKDIFHSLLAINSSSFNVDNLCTSP